MTELNLPQIGFDRFIAYEWAEYALDLVMNEPEDAARRALLKSWLQTQMDGVVAARKTYNLLVRLWFVEYPETACLRADALRLAHKAPQTERLALHWGMCLANFRYFQEVAAIMGRLLRLQGEFSAGTVQQRLLELYSNQGTIPRSTNRLIQTFRDWGVIVETGKSHYQSQQPLVFQNIESIGFLLECALNNQKSPSWALSDVIRKPEFFPFELESNARQAIKEHPRLHLSREGASNEVITLKPGC